MSGTLGFAFAAGAVATVNPCGFALLPAYLARQLGRAPRVGTAAAAGHGAARPAAVHAIGRASSQQMRFPWAR